MLRDSFGVGLDVSTVRKINVEEDRDWFMKGLIPIVN